MLVRAFSSNHWRRGALIVAAAVGFAASALAEPQSAPLLISAPHPEAQDDSYYILRFDSRGERLLTGGAELNTAIWKLSAGVAAGRLPTADKILSDAALSPNGARAALVGMAEAGQIWDVASSTLLTELEQSPDTLRTINFSPDGALVVAGDEQGVVRLWRAEDGRLIRKLAAHDYTARRLTFLQDGARLLTSDGHAVKIWDVASGELLVELSAEPLLAWSLSISPNKDAVVTASRNGQVRVWDIETGEKRVDFQTQIEAPVEVALSADSGRVILIDQSGGLRLFDAETGAPQPRPAFGASAAAVSPDGSMIALRTAAGVQLLDATNLEPIGAPLLTGQSARGGLRFSPTSARLISWSSSAIEIWTLR